jgi:hypothetical protein
MIQTIKYKGKLYKKFLIKLPRQAEDYYTRTCSKCCFYDMRIHSKCLIEEIDLSVVVGCQIYDRGNGIRDCVGVYYEPLTVADMLKDILHD